MNRRQSMIVNVDVKKMKSAEKSKLLTQIIESQIEADCLLPDIYIDDEVIKAEMLLLIKGGSVKCKGGFPKRWVIADSKALSKSTEPSILDRDNKKYVNYYEAFDKLNTLGLMRLKPFFFTRRVTLRTGKISRN